MSTSKKSSISSYKEYRQNKHKKRKRPRDSKLKSSSIDDRYESQSLKWLLSKEYLLNKYNLLRIVVLIVALVLLFLCILYGVGSIITLELDDFWCSNHYSWNEVAEYNRANNESLGVGGCYVADKLQFDEDKVFGTGSSPSALVPIVDITVSGIFKLIMYTGICIAIVWVLMKYILACLIDCRKTVNSEWYVLYKHVFAARMYCVKINGNNKKKGKLKYVNVHLCFHM